MTGAEHYREAEKMLDEAIPSSVLAADTALRATAQVRATLALAAACVASPDGDDGDLAWFRNGDPGAAA